MMKAVLLVASAIIVAQAQEDPGGICCWSADDASDPCGTCNSFAEPTNYCAENQHHCEVDCASGSIAWCPTDADMVPTAAPVATVPADPITLRNLFAESGGKFYVPPDFAANVDGTIANATDPDVVASLAALRDVPSAVWIESTSSLADVATTLEAAAAVPDPPLVVFVVYNLPNRDCGARASTGELCCAYNADGTCNYGATSDCAEGLDAYRTLYVDPLADLLAMYDGVVPVALVIEPDSLAYYATSQADEVCGSDETRAAYAQGIAYAVATIAAHTDDVAMYLDAAHMAWLGWDGNRMAYADVVASLRIEQHLRGFSTNLANYNGVGLPCGADVDCGVGPDAGANPDPCCDDPCGLLAQFNRANNEHNYARLLREALVAAMPNFDPHFVIDTSRNGEPDARAGDCALWCNARGARVGLTPFDASLDPDVVDSYFWLKVPGESDGCTEMLPSGDLCDRFDAACASPGSIGSAPDEPRAPDAGDWFDYQIRQLAEGYVAPPTSAPTIMTPAPAV